MIDRRVERAVDVIKMNLGKRWSSAELAAAVGVSPSRLRCLFKQGMGCTVPGFRRRLQLDAARRQLENIVQVKQVMINVGVNDRGRFARQFKQRFGLTPSEYRDQFLNREHGDEKSAAASATGGSESGD